MAMSPDWLTSPYLNNNKTYIKKYSVCVCILRSEIILLKGKIYVQLNAQNISVQLSFDKCIYPCNQ